jgi:predicted HD phosphohydrolase
MADGEHSAEARAQFHSMVESTQEDWMIISQAAMHFSSELPQRLEAHLMMLKGDCGGFQVDRLEHSLQTATRAHRAGKDEEYVVCALLHDIGDILGPRNHADIGAAILQPYVSEENHWMLEKHGVFQGYYFFHYLGLDRDMREQYRGHPAFEHTAQFCHLFDQSAFDPNYESMPMEAFRPMLGRVLATPKRSIYMQPTGESCI